VTGTIAHYRHKSATSDGTFADGENCRFARRPDEAPKRTAPLNSIVGATAASLGDIRDYREHPDHHEQHRPQASTGRFRGHDGTGVSEQDVLAAYLTAFAKVGLDRYDFPVSPLLIDCQTNQWPRTTQCRERRHPPVPLDRAGTGKTVRLLNPNQRTPTEAPRRTERRGPAVVDHRNGPRPTVGRSTPRASF
jgi:hypothetical protein